MIGYILLGYAASVLIAFVLISVSWPGEGGIGKRLALAVFWPIGLLIVLLVSVLSWSKLYDAIGELFALLGRILSFGGQRVDFVLRPIYRPISPLWSRWLALWPERKRGRVDHASRCVLLWTPIAIFSLVTGRTAEAIFFGVMVGIYLIVILGIYLQIRKQANSS